MGLEPMTSRPDAASMCPLLTGSWCPAVGRGDETVREPAQREQAFELRLQQLDLENDLG